MHFFFFQNKVRVGLKVGQQHCGRVSRLSSRVYGRATLRRVEEDSPGCFLVSFLGRVHCAAQLCSLGFESRLDFLRLLLELLVYCDNLSLKKLFSHYNH